MSRIQLWKARGIPGYLICRLDPETGCYSDAEKDSALVQTDWDYPGVARTFGWNIRNMQRGGADCAHSSTDGTIECAECKVTPSCFIADAAGYLDSNLGKIVEDPGYFS
jgi:hypothetical protein